MALPLYSLSSACYQKRKPRIDRRGNRMLNDSISRTKNFSRCGHHEDDLEVATVLLIQKVTWYIIMANITGQGARCNLRLDMYTNDGRYPHNIIHLYPQIDRSVNCANRVSRTLFHISLLAHRIQSP